MEQMRPVSEKYDLTMLQLASLWNLSQPAVKSVIPTLIQEADPKCKSIESKVEELACLQEIELEEEDLQRIAEIGDNRGCMELKGGNPSYVGEPLPDRWPLSADLEAVADKWGIDPRKDLVCTHGKAA
jgi:hypothetical protein